ncbi:MAG TPA: WD40 repeat domain-containing protein, partial [Kofleriaceae bacterium]
AGSVARALAFSPDGSELAIVSENQLIVRPLPHGDARTASSRTERIPLSDQPTRVVDAAQVTYSSDLAWLAVTCENGDIWFYRRHDGRWIYRSVGTARIVSGEFSPDSTMFATADVTGKVQLFDMTASSLREPPP